MKTRPQNSGSNTESQTQNSIPNCCPRVEDSKEDHLQLYASDVTPSMELLRPSWLHLTIEVTPPQPHRMICNPR